MIKKQELIELWMAQGFLQIDPKNGMEVEGNKFFYFLVQNSFLQVARRDKYGNITRCSMHDLVHDLACIVSKGIYQVQYIGSKSGGEETNSIPKERWRTLFFKGNALSDSMFSDFKNLHTLTVRDYHVNELPNSISELIHLRCINVNYTRIQEFPEWIGELYHLQTIRAKCLSKLPSTVQYLINLRHLHLEPDTELPPNIGRLSCLQTLEYYHVGKDESCGIGELGRLKNLQGDLHILNLENVRHQEEAESALLFEKQKMCKLVLQWSTTREGETNDENVLEGLRSHPNLKRLEIIGFKGLRFSSWTSDMEIGLYNLVKVSLKDISECEQIPMMGHSPYLKSLSLSCLSNVKSLRSSFMYGSYNETIVVFPMLKHLKLSEMPNLVEWIEIELSSIAENHPLEIKVFPCLEKLKIIECKNLRIAPSQFPCQKESNFGLPTPSICGSLKKLEIAEVDGLECLPDWFHNNQNLSTLHIHRCDNLRELPDGIHTLNSLKVLDIYGCPNLKTIPHRSVGESQGLRSLETLSISDCEGLISLPCEMVCAPSLQHLSLWGATSLINLPMIIECLAKSPIFKSLNIGNVPRLISPPGVLHNLEELEMKPAASDSCDSAKKAVDGILQAASHSLRQLSLCGMEDWDSLPHSLLHLRALSTLELNNFKIEELPEWFRNLTSLQRLHLCKCHELRHVKAMRRLKKLTTLWIYDCLALKSCIEQCNDVSHIPNIVIV